MATDTEPRKLDSSASPGFGQAEVSPGYDAGTRTSSKAPLILLVLFVIVCLTAIIAWVLIKTFRSGETDAKGVLTHAVERTNMLITVSDDGNVESASNVDIKCQVAGGGTILWIVEDGKRVTGGLETSAPIPFDGDAEAVKTALVDGMPSISDDDVVVSGEGTEASPFVIELIGDLGEKDVAKLSVDATFLAGDVEITVGKIQTGRPGVSDKQSFHITPSPSDGMYTIDWNPSGELLVLLDTAALEEQLQQQKIVHEQALAMKIQSEENSGAAALAVREFAEGTYLQQLQVAEANIQIATEALQSSENVLEYTEKMVRKGFATPLQLEADRSALRQAQFNLEAAETAKRVLEDFTYEKTMKELVAAREAAAAQYGSDKASLELEETKLARLQQQIASSRIYAPASGMAVYANDNSRRRSSSEPTIEEGAPVREGQTILRLPDLANMQAKMTVHESKVDQIAPGMPARITILGQSHTGHVVSIANQPEPGSWFSANVKEYATTVAIDGQTSGLRPGMTASVVVLIDEIEDALVVPVSSVVQKRGRFYCYLRTEVGPEEREVIVGRSNEAYVQIIDGVKEGDVVLRNPRAVVPNARDDTPLEERSTERSEFGERVEVPPDERGAGGPGAAGPGGGGQGGLMTNDVDGDGKISRDEAPEWLRGSFDSVDANGDGLLESTELRALRQQRGGGGRGPGGGGQGFRGPGGGGPGARGAGGAGRGGARPANGDGA